MTVVEPLAFLGLNFKEQESLMRKIKSFIKNQIKTSEILNVTDLFFFKKEELMEEEKKKFGISPFFIPKNSTKNFFFFRHLKLLK